MSAERITHPAIQSLGQAREEINREMGEDPRTPRDRPCTDVCDEFRALAYRVSQSEEMQGTIMAELTEHKRILTKLDGRLDQQTENQATLATTMASSSRTATMGGYLAGGGGTFLAIIEGGRMVGHSLGWW
jgi:phosphate starvation-inducible protein PhoH